MNEISIFGSKCRIEIIIICLLAGFIAGGYMLCGCIRPIHRNYEGMTNNPSTTSNDYNANGGSQYSWLNQELEEENNALGGNDNTYMLINNDDGEDDDDTISMFADTKTSPTCNSSVSGYGGMYCVTPEQKKLICTRGGNRSASCGSDY